MIELFAIWYLVSFHWSFYLFQTRASSLERALLDFDREHARMSWLVVIISSFCLTFGQERKSFEILMVLLKRMILLINQNHKDSFDRKIITFFINNNNEFHRNHSKYIVIILVNKLLKNLKICCSITIFYPREFAMCQLSNYGNFNFNAFFLSKIFKIFCCS